METKFQTSFIPKRTLVSDQKIISVKSGTSIIMLISTILFIISVAGAVFSVIYTNIITKNQESYKARLIDSEKRFNITLIEDLKKANTKIDLSKQLLKKHISTPEIFSILSELTTENVRFSSFSFSLPTKDNEGIKIALSGIAKDFYTIAFQSDVFGSSEKFGKNKILKNPVVSDVSELENGSVRFSFSATINPEDLLYSKILAGNIEE